MKYVLTCLRVRTACLEFEFRQHPSVPSAREVTRGCLSLPVDTRERRVWSVLVGTTNGIVSSADARERCVRDFRASAVFVGIYEPTKQKLLKLFPDNLSVFAHLTAGVIGGAASSLIRVPTEVVKQRMQTRQFASTPDAVRLIVAKEGFRGLYAGYGSFLLRDLPFDAIQFCLYEQLRIGYRAAANRELSDQETAVIGAFAGAITGAITTPLDVLKTRLMTQGSIKQYNGLISCTKTIIKEEGPAALLKGIGPRVLWIGIGGSIFFGVLEKTKALLARQNSLDLKSDPSKQK